MDCNRKMTDLNSATADQGRIVRLPARYQRCRRQQRSVAHQQHFPEAQAGTMRRSKLKDHPVQAVNGLYQTRVVGRILNRLKVFPLRIYIAVKAHDPFRIARRRWSWNIVLAPRRGSAFDSVVLPPRDRAMGRERQRLVARDGIA